MMQRLLRNQAFVIGAIFFGIVVLAAVLAPLIAPYAPDRNNFRYRLGPPTWTYLMGTDGFGRDVLSRVLYGCRLSLRISLAVMLLSTAVGVPLGLLAGYFRQVDDPVMRLLDAMMAFPTVMLATALAAFMAPSEISAALALSIALMPRTARVARAAALTITQMDYVKAARACGAGHLHILLRHVLTNSMAPLLVQLTFVMAGAILGEAVLSFIGVGPPPPTPSLGNIIADGRNYIIDAPWMSLMPGCTIVLAVLGLNFLGDGLRDVLDPRLQTDIT
jgi:peptide/nickel transport system permease protein